MCLAGAVVASWSFTQEAAKWQVTVMTNVYRPQRSCGKVMFLHLADTQADTPLGRQLLQRTIHILSECILVCH